MYTQPKLSFELGDLEPYIDAQTMDLHYNKHHKGYIDKYNAAVAGTEFADTDIEEVIKSINSVPETIRTAVNNNGCQAYNHSFFWTMLKKNGGGNPVGEIADTINDTFGSFEAFKEEFSNKATTLFGSGWVWLQKNNGKLEIVQMKDEGTPLKEGAIPVMTLDVWEHAYYLKYQNRRPEYIENWWHVLDWEQINNYFKQTQ